MDKNLNAFARERLVVGAAAGPLTASVYEHNSAVGTANRKRAQYARVQVLAGGGDIIVTIDGTTPSASVGETWKPVAAGFSGIYELRNATEIAKFKAIRAGADTSIEVTYFSY